MDSSWHVKISQIINHHYYPHQKQYFQQPQKQYSSNSTLDMGEITTFRVEPVENYNLCGHENHLIVSDLDGTLTRDPSPFAYFMLVALEAGSPLRGLLLLLFYPLIWFLHAFVSLSASTKLLIFISTAGLRLKDIAIVGRAVLCKFYLEDLHSQSYRVFLSCGKRCVVTSTPRLMVEHFLREYLGVEHVLGTELHSFKGYCTGFATSSAGILVGSSKRDAVKNAFKDKLPDIGLASNRCDSQFFSLCKEAYLVDPNKPVEAVRREHYLKPLVFHDGRLAMRPTPMATLAIFLWFPAGLFVGIIRIMAFLLLPSEMAAPVLAMSGIKVRVKGAPPVLVQPQLQPKPAAMNGEQDQEQNHTPQDDKDDRIVFACSHKTLLDPLFVSGVLRRKVTAVVYSISKVSEFLSPVTIVRLKRERNHDDRLLRKLLEKGDIIVCPEGTTCREPYLLRFSSLFAEVCPNIVPVALDVHLSMFQGTSARGLKALDPFFFLLNPQPTYFISFLDPIAPQNSCFQGGCNSIQVANNVQRQIAQVLGFSCTTFTRKDKYMMLAGNDGTHDP